MLEWFIYTQWVLLSYMKNLAGRRLIVPAIGYLNLKKIFESPKFEFPPVVHIGDEQIGHDVWMTSKHGIWVWVPKNHNVKKTWFFFQWYRLYFFKFKSCEMPPSTPTYLIENKSASVIISYTEYLVKRPPRAFISFIWLGIQVYFDYQGT